MEAAQFADASAADAADHYRKLDAGGVRRSADSDAGIDYMEAGEERGGASDDGQKWCDLILLSYKCAI